MIRRNFLKLVCVSVLAPQLLSAQKKVRAPYVQKGDLADYIGRSPGGFSGARPVMQVDAWDGKGYPVHLYSPYKEQQVFYDQDLVDFNKEIPPRFWWDKQNCKLYNNVHTYVRVKRFGETREQAVAYLNFTTKI